jgi:hypothetical protein
VRLYLDLAAPRGTTVARSEPREEAFVVDRAGDGQVLGVEILAFGAGTIARLRALLEVLGVAERVDAEKLAPLARP